MIVAGVAFIGGSYLAFGPGAAVSGQTALRAGDPEAVALGADVYAASCAACHGVDLEGQPEWRSPGPDGRLPAPPHDETGHTWHHDGDALFRLTKYGVGSIVGDPNYASNMPVYEGVLTDEEIVAALSYIKSTWPREIRDRHDAMQGR
ncbi:MAG: cytochrome c [Erythrobacter sp.]